MFYWCGVRQVRFKTGLTAFHTWVMFLSKLITSKRCAAVTVRSFWAIILGGCRDRWNNSGEWFALPTSKKCSRMQYFASKSMSCVWASLVLGYSRKQQSIASFLNGKLSHTSKNKLPEKVFIYIQLMIGLLSLLWSSCLCLIVSINIVQ